MKCKYCAEIITGVNPKQLAHHNRIHIGREHPGQYAISGQPIKQEAIA